MRKIGELRKRKKKFLFSMQTMIAVFTLLLILGGSLLGSSLSNARNLEASREDPVYKYYTSIQIQEGDTLWEIADSYLKGVSLEKSEYIKEIKRLNKIDEDHIQSGQHLLIPYYSKEYL